MFYQCWHQASMGCKQAGASLAELADPAKEAEVLALIEDEVGLRFLSNIDAVTFVRLTFDL
jgi:hypothetical protein